MNEPATLQSQACKCYSVLPRLYELSVEVVHSPYLSLADSSSALSTMHRQHQFGLITHLCRMALLVLKGTGRRVVASWDWPLGWATWAA